MNDILLALTHETGMSFDHHSDHERLKRYLDRGSEIWNGDQLSSLFIDFMMINETYFDREKRHFDLFVEHILPSLGVNEQTMARVLFAPCSTGEEPYSIALRLAQSSYHKASVELLGIDISTKAIMQARQGCYTGRAIHELPADIVERYFTPTPDGHFSLHDEIRHKVHFEQGNVFDNLFLDRLGLFDVVFSRNMMIYFDKAYSRRFLDSLRKKLYPGGYVILGHADDHAYAKELFEPLLFGKTMIYRHTKGS